MTVPAEGSPANGKAASGGVTASRRVPLAARPALAFTELGVRRMPGFRDGGFTLHGLGPGINLVHGPNASGKSTVARSLQALLWPASAPARASLLGRASLEDGAWRIDLDAGHVQCQRDGEDASPPPVAPVETSDRYYLSLQDLLTVEGRDLAAVVLKESSGGYDVGEAADAAGFRARTGSPRRAIDALRKARAALRRAHEAQDTLRDRAASLRELEQDKREASRAMGRLRAVQKAREYRKALESSEASRRELERFPKGIGRLAGTELEALEGIRRRLDDDRGRLDAARAELERARRECERVSFPDGGLPAGFVAGLRERVNELASAEQTLRERAQEIARLDAELREERARFGDAMDDRRARALARVGPAELERLHALAARAEEFGARRHALQAVSEWAGDLDRPADLEALREAASHLHQWLARGETDPARERRLRVVSGLAAAGLLVAGVVLALALHLAGLILAALALPLLYVLARSGRTDDGKQRLRQAFERLGVPRPGSWTVEAVEARAAELHREMAQATLAAEKEARFGDLGKKRAAIDEELASLEAQRASLVDEIGLAPDLEHPAVAHLVSRIARWQDLTTRRAGAARAHDEAARQRDRLVAALREAVAPFGLEEMLDGPALDGPAVAGVVDDLSRREAEHDKARAAVATSERAIEEAGRRIRAAEAEERALYERAGLEPGDESTLRAYASEREAYAKARERARDLEREAARLAEDLAGHPDLMECTPEQIDEELKRCEEAARRYDRLVQEIGRIQGQVEDAKQKHDIEEKLAAVEDCREALRRQRDEDQAAVVGHEIAAWLRCRTRDLERPRVFHRARELLLGITNGRHRLELHDEEDPPAFRAVDTVTDIGHDLDELSSATRVQLLLAVRVAFIEEQEQGPSLPLLLDETLGNCDDRRAKAIIRAATEIVRSGRQIFYFTAQGDEAGKWLAELEGSDVPVRRIDLAEARGLAESERSGSIAIDRPPRREVPEPQGMSRAAYGRELGVPSFDPRRGNVSSVHLWHLVDDLSVLHRLLCLDITRWGQLESLVRFGGGAGFVEQDGVLDRACAAADLLDYAARQWQRGRGRPVDREALQASGAVSDAFLDEVADLAKSFGGDAARLLDALERKRVKRFQSKSCERLRTWLTEEGYLDESRQLSRDELRASVLGTARRALEEGLLTPARVDELLASLPE